MTFYVQTYPYRRMTRRWVADRAQTLGVNIREETDAFVLSALVPGLQAEDLNIQVLEDVVRIAGEYRQNGTDESDYLVRELPTGSFTRTLRLPAPVDADQVEAEITDGVLSLRLPKAESARPRQIKVNAR